MGNNKPRTQRFSFLKVFALHTLKCILPSTQDTVKIKKHAECSEKAAKEVFLLWIWNDVCSCHWLKNPESTRCGRILQWKVLNCEHLHSTITSLRLAANRHLLPLSDFLFIHPLSGELDLLHTMTHAFVIDSCGEHRAAPSPHSQLPSL